MAKKQFEVRFKPTQPGDSYLEANAESFNTIEQRLLENIRESGRLLGHVLWDVHQLHARRIEWGYPNESDVLTQLARITHYSVKYLRDLIRIGEMLLNHQREALIADTSMRCLRALLSKSHEEQQNLLERMQFEQINEDDIRNYGLKLVEPTTTPATKNLAFTQNDAQQSLKQKNFNGQTIYLVNPQQIPEKKQIKHYQKLIKQMQQNLQEALK